MGNIKVGPFIYFNIKYNILTNCYFRIKPYMINNRPMI